MKRFTDTVCKREYVCGCNLKYRYILQKVKLLTLNHIRTPQINRKGNGYHSNLWKGIQLPGKSKGKTF